MEKTIRKSLLFMLSAVIVFTSLNINVKAEMKYGNDHLEVQVIEKDGLINIGIGELNGEVQVQSVTYIANVVSFNENRVYSFDVGEEVKPMFTVQYTYENKPEEHVINYQSEIKVLDEELPEDNPIESLTDEELVQLEIDKLTPEELEKYSGEDDRSWENEEIENPVEYIESEYDEYIEMDEQYINYEKTSQISSYSLPNTVNVVKSNRFYGGFDHWRMPSHPQYHPSWQFYGWNWADLTVNGELVFCMNPEVKIPNGTGYNSTSDWNNLTAQQRNRIMLIGVYGSDYPGQDTELFKIAEQAMTWEVVHHGSSWNRDFSKERAIINRRIEDHRKTLQKAGSTQKVNVGGTYTLTDPLLQDYTVKVGTGVKIISNSGNALTYRIESAKFDSTISFIKKSGRSNGQSVIYKKPGNQDIVAIRNSDPRDTFIKLELSSSNYNIKKTDESGNPVSGAVYGMSYSNSVDSNGFLNTSVFKYTTGANGQTPVDVWNKAGSTIYYQELSAPNPYIIDKTIRKHVAVGGETKTFSVTNKKATGTIEVIKKDNTGKLYSGAQYRIKNVNGSVVATVTTNANGSAKTGALPLGVYTVEEIKAPVPLILNSTPQTVRLLYKDQNTPVVTGVHTQTNLIAQGRISVTKVDESGVKYSGAVFVIKNSSGTEVDRISTNASGLATSKYLPLGNYTVTEVTAPRPLLLESTPKSVSLVYKDQNTEVVSTGFTKINKKPTGTLTITKKSETGVAYAGVTYEVRNSTGKVVATPVTGTIGSVTVSSLPLGNYTVTEISVPKELILDSIPKNVTIAYKDQVTPVIYVSTNFVNRYKPIVTFGIEKIQIDTQKQSSGLTVKTWFSKVQHYDYSINNFGEEIITLDLVDTKTGKVVSNKHIKIKDLALQYDFKVTPPDLKVNSSSNYEVRINTKAPNRITIKQQKLATHGYTASEKLIRHHADNKQDILDKSVIRTERSYAREMLTYYETTEITYDQIQPQRTGRGFEYNITALYKNDLNNEYNFHFDFMPDKKLVDSSYLPYSNQENPVFNLIKRGNVYTLPRVRTEVRTGEVISEEQWLNLGASQRERYLDGGNKLYVPIWRTDLGSYNTQLKSKSIGVNEISVEINDYAKLFGFMFGWYDTDGISPSSNHDGIVTSPVIAHNPFPTGIPDNWGFSQANGQKSLTSVEQEFFGQKSDYSVRYNLNGGTGITVGDMVANGGTHTVTDQIPVKTGSRFVGWKLNGVNVSSGQKITVHQDLNIQALWEESSYRVEFNTNGGSSIDAVTVEYGTTVIKPINPTKEGFTFRGWSPDINQVIVSDTTFSTIWEIDSFNVLFATGGGSVIENQTIKYGQYVQIPNNPIRDGYTFTGWLPSLSDQIQSDTRFEAQWEDNYYIVAFDTQSEHMIEAQSIKHGQRIEVPENPTRLGHTFVGWDTDTNLLINKYTTFKALWEVNTFTVKFNTIGGNKINNQTIEYGKTVEVPEVPYKEGFEFISWDRELYSEITEDTTFNALWSGKNHTVYFETDGGTPVEKQTISYGETVQLPEVPIKVGATFVGWEPNIESEIKTDTVFKAIWSSIDYQVSFDTDGGTIIKDQTVNHGESVEVPEDPIKEGYYFIGWDKGLELGIEEHTVFKAVWSINTYSVVYVFNNGESSIEEIVKHGTIPENVPNPEKEDFTFVEWLPSLENPILEDTIFVAQWEINGHKVEFNSGIDTQIDYQIVIDGEKANEPDVELVREGYTFQGWSPDISETTILSEVTFNAIWEEMVPELEEVKIQNKSELLTDRFRKWWITPEIRKRK